MVRDWFVVLVFAFLFAWVLTAHAEPQSALPYRNTLIREVRADWGFDGPTALFASQIDQESAWNPRACSAYACGLAQFTPATAADIDKKHLIIYPNDVYNPAWAIRALVLYDHDLYGQIGVATTDCDRWGFTLSAYNGGLGNVRKDMALCNGISGCDGRRWLDNVELHSSRSAAAFRENRAYPRNIFKKQSAYSGWGAEIQCP